MGVGSEAVRSSTQGDDVARLVAQARVLGAAGALVLKLGLIAGAGLVWMTVADGARHRFPTERQPVIACVAFLTGLLWICVASHLRRWRPVAALVGVGASFVLFVGWWSYIRPDYYSPGTPSLRALCGLSGPAALAGGLASIVAWMLCRRPLDRLSVSGAFAGACPELQGGGGRPAIDSLLAQAENGLAGALSSARCMCICGTIVLLSALSWSWVRWMSYSRRPLDANSLAEAIPWLVIGIIVGGILGVLLMPAGRLRSIIAITLIYLVSIAIGWCCYYIWRSRAVPAAVTAPAIVFAISVAGAAASALFTQFIAASAIRWLLPVPIQRHLLGDRAVRVSEQPSRAASVECCEDCGYQLEGLPTVTCEACGTLELRCPECGHCQPAGTLHARAIHRLCKAHVAVRVGSWLLALAAMVTVLAPWILIGSELEHIVPDTVGWKFAMCVLMTMVLIAPVRFLLMHWRPWIVGTLLATILPGVAMLVGISLSDDPARKLGQPAGIVLAISVFASSVFPLIWRGWLRLMLPRETAKTARAWHRSVAFRWRGDEFWEHAGTQIPLTCQACGADSRSSALRACGQCSVLINHCSACSSRTPINKVRVAFESMVHRGKAVLCVSLAATGLLLLLIVGFILADVASRLYYRTQYAGPDTWTVLGIIGSAWAAFAVAGAVGSIVLMNRGKAVAAAWTLALCALPAGIAVSSVMISRNEFPARLWHPALLMVVAGLLGAATFISALLAPLLLEAIARMLLPAKSAAALFAWLGGRSSLDDAGAAMSRSGQAVPPCP